MNPYTLDVPAKKNPQGSDPEDQNLTPASDLIKEISWSETDLYKAFYAYGQNPDPVVKHKGLKIYEDMMEDDQVKACIELRKQARLSTPWSILPGKNESPEAQKYADFITHVLLRMKGVFEDDLYQIYSAIEFGFSISELVYELLEDGPFAGKMGLRAIKTREPFNYDFKVDEHGNLLGIVYTGAIPNDAETRTGNGLATLPQNNSGKIMRPGMAQPGANYLGSLEFPFPPEKFIIYSYNMKFGNYYGRSDLFSAFRSYLIKKHVMKFWSVWLERYASPFIWAQVKATAGMKPAALKEIDAFLKLIGTRNAIRVTDDVTLNPIQFSTAGGDAYEKAIEAHNRFISHAILCPNLLGYTQQQTTGSYALGKKHFDAFVWTLEKMGRDTSEAIVGEQIIKRLINLNFPNVDQDLLPTFKFEGIEEESIESRSRIVTILAQNGFLDPGETWIRDFLTLPKREVVLVKGDEEIIPLPAKDDESDDKKKNEEKNKLSLGNSRDAEAGENKFKRFAEEDLVEGPGGENGIWRTINGRAIFIPIGSGESIADAIQKRLGGKKKGDIPTGEEGKTDIGDLGSKIHEGKLSKDEIKSLAKAKGSQGEVIRTLRDYSGDHYSEIRETSVAIEEGNKSGINKKYEAGVSELNKMVKKSPVITKPIYRATSTQVDFKVGDTFDTKGISSFTKSLEASTKFFDEDNPGVIYRVKKGRGLDISSISKFEQESEVLVLGEYKVAKVTQNWRPPSLDEKGIFLNDVTLYDLEQI